MAKNWKQQTMDLVEDCDSSCATDSVDGNFHGLTRNSIITDKDMNPAKMIGRGTGVFTKFSTQAFFEEEKETLDSGLDSFRADSFKDIVQDHDIRCSSIGDVDKELNKLNIGQSKNEPASPSSLKRKQVEVGENCQSIDEAYVSGNGVVSSIDSEPNRDDIGSVFTAQNQEGDR